ncbi:hypothetical protein FA13DRAFT_1780020 [Coprinellus micaceus]|uniref:Uncharacterized protein n=1 Tax=Coprinellus micaceus TaxID=71717 RepID=A0A4Y7SEH9_COPMI|nr:hypothetical protein FA13DRAFT_1780020 [Coprinellus micaceus]
MPARSPSPGSHRGGSARPRSSSPSREISLPLPSPFADGLAKNLYLTPAQSRELHTLIQLGKRDLEPGDLLFRLASHAVQLRSQNLLLELLSKDTTATTTLEDVKKIFKGPASLTPVDKFINPLQTTILNVVKDMMVAPSVMSYTTVDVKIKRRLLEKQDEFGLAHLFDDPSRQQVLDTYLKTTCRSIRGQLRSTYVKAVVANDTHDKVAKAVARFRAGDRLTMPANFLARVLIIYSWARSNITVEDVAQAESNTNDIDDNNHSSTEGSEAPTRKRQRCSKKSSGGKTAKEDAFWPRVDEHLQALVNRFGPNLASGEWATYILKLVSDEQTSVQRATVQTPTFANAFEQLTGTFDLSLFTPQPTLPDPAPALAMTTSNRRRTASPSPGRGPSSPHPRTVTPHLPSSRPVTPMNIPSRPAQHLQQQPALPPSPYLPPDYRSHQHPSRVPTHHHQLSFAPQRPPTAIGTPPFRPALSCPSPAPRPPHSRPGSTLGYSHWERQVVNGSGGVPQGAQAHHSSPYSGYALPSPYLSGHFAPHH